MEANEHVNNDHRQSESPARTIDSLGSTVGSMETIVDRNEELMQITMESSTNTTNLDRHSLTNSQISIITKDEKSNGIPHDAQSHIYSSPVYMTTTAKPLNSGGLSQIELPKLISHAEFEKQQLGRPKSTELTKSSTATLESKISKKQRFPPELIKIKGDSNKDFKVSRHRRRNSFPNQVSLGVFQLLLSIALVALGALLVVRGASLATIGSGIWTGGIAAIAGALGVINMRKVQTGFLALSLVCIATSTLALAITGVGLTRDISKMDEKINQTKLNNEKITAAYWLVLALGLHFIVSVISVYKSASRLCSSKPHDDSMYDTMNNSGLPIDPETIEEYIKAMSLSSGTNNLIKKEQLAPQLIYPTMKPPGSVKANSIPSRSVILIPASMGSTLLTPTQQPLTQMMRPPLGLPPPYHMMLPPGATLPPPPPPLVYRGGMTLPHKRPGRFYASHRSQMPSARQQRHHPHSHPHPHQEINGRHSKPHRRTCNSDSKSEGNRGRHQRRKSDTDANNRKAFIGIGLDRETTDSFLAWQEQIKKSHIDYSSSGEPGRNECHDVAM